MKSVAASRFKEILRPVGGDPQSHCGTRRLRVAQLDQLAIFGICLQLGLVVLAGLVIAVGTGPDWLHFAVSALVATAVIAQTAVALGYRKADTAIRKKEIWARRFTFSFLLMGVAWGIAGLILVASPEPAYLALGAFGLAVLALPAGAWFFPAFAAFLIPGLLPSALDLLLNGDPARTATGAVALGQLAVLLGSGWVISRRYSVSILRQIQSDDRIEQLLTARGSESTIQARLEAALESMSEALAVFDADDRLVICNRRFMGEQRAGQAKDLVGIHFDELVARDIPNAGIVNAIGREAEYVAERIAYHKRCQGSFEIQLSDGRILQVRDRRTSDGGTVIVQTDITAYRRAEEDLRAAKEKAERANRAKSELLANTSHELRTPLNAIIGFSQVMEDELFGSLGNPRYCGYAKDIRQSGEYLISVINDLLDLSKIEAGRQDPENEAVDLAEIVNNAVKVTHERAESVDLSVRQRISRDLPRVWADRRMVQQIVLNLLSNAVKFTPAGGTVTICAEPAQAGGLLVEVSDTGIGMTVEDLERAFEPFGRARGALVRNAEGSGLGLPLSRSLAKLQGAALDVESTPGKGTTARLYFPAECVLALDSQAEVPFKPALGA